MGKQSLMIFLLFVLLLGGIIFFVFTRRTISRISDDQIVAYINQESVTYRELKGIMNSKRNEVYSYFNQNFKIEDNSMFWTTSFAGEIPLLRLKHLALEEVVNIKVQQIIGREYEVIENIEYSSFLNRWKEENARRENAVKNNQVIYGPTNYGEIEYFNYEFNNMVLDIQRKMKLQEQIPRTELEKIYDEIKEDHYKNPDTRSKGYEPFHSVKEDLSQIYIERLYGQEVQKRLLEVVICTQKAFHKINIE